MKRLQCKVLFFLLLLMALPVACSDEVLKRLERQPVATPPLTVEVFKNKTTSVEVNYCTLPAKQKFFKTKFIVVFDRSGSNQECPAEWCGTFIPGTDPDNSRRYDGMQHFLESLSEEQRKNSSFALVNFNDPDDCGNYCIPTAQMNRGHATRQKTFLPHAEFTQLLRNEKNPNNQNSSLIKDLGGTNYKSALDVVISILTSDINALSGLADQYAYVVVFVSDGAPTVFRPSGNAYFYRQSWRNDLKAKVDAILGFNSYERVLGIMLNTVYYSAPGVPPNSGNCNPQQDPNCAPCLAGDPSCTPQELLAVMAREGGGTFLDYTQGGAIDFTRISLPSISTSFNLVEFFATNNNVIWHGGLLVRDSNANGIADEVESSSRGVAKNSCPPVDVDTDQDGLGDCLEKILGSDVNSFDSNGDFVPDGLASLRGILFKKGDPPCSNLDSDLDGVNDCQEVKLNTPPNLPNSSVKGLVPQQYSVLKTENQQTKQCYVIQVENIPVLTSQDRIRFFAVERADLFETASTLRKAEKPVVGNKVFFYEEDFQ